MGTATRIPVSRAWRIAVTTRSRRVASPRKAAHVRCRRSWRRRSARGRVSRCQVRPAPKAVIRATARTFETPKSRSRSRRVRRSRSRASSWRMASGRASSQRGVAGKKLPDAPLMGRAEGRRDGGHLLRHVSERSFRRQGWPGAWGAWHKAGYGMVRTGGETSAGTGGREAHTGRPEPVTRRAGAEDGAAVDTPGTRRLSGLFPGSVPIPLPDFG